MLLIFKEALTPNPTPPSTPDTTTMKPKCKVPGWNDIEGHEIYLGEIYTRNTTLSWFEADAKAVEVGGYLAEITSEKETKIFQKVQECKNMLSLLDEVLFCNKSSYSLA